MMQGTVVPSPIETLNGILPRETIWMMLPDFTTLNSQLSPHLILSDLTKQLTKQRPFWCLRSVSNVYEYFCWICLAEKRFYTRGGYLKKRRLFYDIPPKVRLWHQNDTSVHVKKPSFIGSKYKCATHTHTSTMSHTAGLERLCHRGIFFDQMK